MVRNHDSFIHVCVDYRALNECTVKDSFLLPGIDSLLDKLHIDCVKKKLNRTTLIFPAVAASRFEAGPRGSMLRREDR
jgi:hypothetical protein